MQLQQGSGVTQQISAEAGTDPHVAAMLTLQVGNKALQFLSSPRALTAFIL